MPNKESATAVDQLALIIRIDDKRAGDDPFKLPVFLRADATADFETLTDLDQATAPAEGDRSAASARRQRALAELERQLRGGFRFLDNIDEEEISDAERTKALEAYGWKGAKIGTVLDSQDKLLTNARLAIAIGSEEVPNAAHRYPEARLRRIQTQLQIAESSQDVATGGERQETTKLRDDALAVAATTISRVRFYYCCASRDSDETTELKRIGYQPRRAPGTVGGETSESPARVAPLGAGGSPARPV